MPGSVIPINGPLHGRHAGVYALIQAALPQRPVRNIGVLLIDRATDRPYFRLRSHFHDIADPEDVEVLAEIEEYIRACTAQTGGEAFLRSLEDTASHAIRVTDRQEIQVESFTSALDRLY